MRELVNRDYKVRVLVRPKSNLSALESWNVEIVKGKLTDKKDIMRAVSGCRYVIHSAALAIHKPTRLEAFKKVNIGSTLDIIDACRQQGVDRLVYVSTANCFASGTRAEPGTEDNQFPSWMKSSGYAYSKMLAQQQVLDEVKKGGLDAVVVNPTFIIGRDIKPDGGKIFNFIWNKRVAFYPMGGKNFIDAKAAAVGVVNSMEKGRIGDCYLLAGEYLSYRQFYRIVVGYTGQNTIMLPMPCFLLKLAGVAGNFFEKVLKKPVQLTLVNARMLCIKSFYSPDKAIRELDLPIVPAKEAIETALEWFVENHNKQTKGN